MPLISEIQPNPNSPGNDPETQEIEFFGDPNTTYSGFLTSIESDIGTTTGQINAVYPINVSFGADGIATVTVDDLENPSYTLVLSENDPSINNSDLDADDNGVIDDVNIFGNVEDAVGVRDHINDQSYAADLDGIDLEPLGNGDNNEPSLIFREGSGGDWFIVNQDGTEIYDSGGVLVTNDFPPEALSPNFGIINPCFLENTLILTENAYKKIKDLKVGEMLKTKDGQLIPIKWIRIHKAKINTANFKGNPICFKAGSLGKNTPINDLYVSPDHAMFIDDLLINAGALVNGATIVETYPSEDFYYYHIELETHELIIAEGATTESYLPQNNEQYIFENQEEFDKLYPTGNNLMLWPLEYPRISSIYNVPNYISQKLMEISCVDYNLVE